MTSPDIHIGFYCSSTSWGGLEMNVVRFANWMTLRGWRVTLYTVPDSKITQRAKELGLNLRGIEKNKKYFDFKNARKVSRIFQEDQVDLVWLRDTRDIGLIGLTKRMSAHPVKVLYQQAMQLGVKKTDLAHTMRFNQIDAWISPLEYLADQVRTMTKFDHQRIHTIPLAIEGDSFKHLPSRKEALNHFQLSEDPLYLGIIGRIDPLKGQLFAIRATAELRRQGLNAELLLVGEPTMDEGTAYLDILHREVESLVLKNFIHFRPFTNDVKLFFSAIDLTILASVGETFGMVTIESMFCKTAIVGTNTSGTPDLLGHGEYGLLYSPENMEEFLSQTKPLLESEETRNKLISKAHESAQRRFEHNQVCAKIEGVINSLFSE